MQQVLDNRVRRWISYNCSQFCFTDQWMGSLQAGMPAATGAGSQRRLSTTKEGTLLLAPSKNGSWAKGKGQSRRAVKPLFLMEGDDGAANLRNRCGDVAAAYNKLKKKGSLTVTIKGRSITLPLTLLAAADFLFFKAIMNMSTNDLTKTDLNLCYPVGNNKMSRKLGSNN